MAAPSPVALAGRLPGFVIHCGGKPLNAAIQAASIDVEAAANEIPRVRVVLVDDDPEMRAFRNPEFDPGSTIEIALGYDGINTTVFIGKIRSQAIEGAPGQPARLVIEAVAGAFAMTLARGNAVFQATTDSAVLSGLIQSAGLSADVSGTTQQHAAIVRYDCTAWDLLLMRAQANAMVVIAHGNSVQVAPPKTTESAVLSLKYGESVLGFSMTLDAAHQVQAASIQSFAWQPQSQALVQSGSASTDVRSPGDIPSSRLAEAFGVSDYRQQSSGMLDQEELAQWSGARLERNVLAKIRGEISFPGSALVKPGSMVSLAGFGPHFDGDAWVSGVSHRMVDGNWTTRVTLGLAPEWFGTDLSAAGAPPAAGLIPAAPQLQTGLVKQVDQDPQGEYRVLVTLPLLGEHEKGVWARLASFFASSGAGACFYPQVGDEVVLGFMGGDPRYPVILGSLYSQAKQPAFPPPSEAGQVRALTSASKLELRFEEGRPALTLTTPRQQRVTLDDAAKTVTITDCNANSITMGETGITLRSGGDLVLEASQSIRIAAGANLSLTAPGNLAATGSGGARLTSDGFVKISGAMVTLNP